MRDAAADLEFEEAARLRDEIKRLEAIELAVSDDPLARQGALQREAGAFGAPAAGGRSTQGLAGQRPKRTRPQGAIARRPSGRLPPAATFVSAYC